jgi:hypothetical protein
VGGQIIHNHRIARPECRNQLLLDIGEEDAAIHGTIDDHRSGDAGGSQCTDKRGRLPVTIRNLADHPLTSEGAALPAAHHRVGSCFIDENQLLRVEMSLPETPSGAVLGHVGAILFSRPQNFF